jgi:hypothetical protein
MKTIAPVIVAGLLLSTAARGASRPQEGSATALALHCTSASTADRQKCGVYVAGVLRGYATAYHEAGAAMPFCMTSTSIPLDQFIKDMSEGLLATRSTNSGDKAISDDDPGTDVIAVISAAKVWYPCH